MTSGYCIDSKAELFTSPEHSEDCGKLNTKFYSDNGKLCQHSLSGDWIKSSWLIRLPDGSGG